MLIPLICKQCGGKLEVEESRVIESGDMVIVLNDQTFKCPHCGVSHIPGERLKQMAPASVSQIHIAGNVSGGVFVIGNGVTVHTPLQPVTEPDEQLPGEVEEVNQQKKWWEFWKK